MRGDGMDGKTQDGIVLPGWTEFRKSLNIKEPCVAKL